MPYDFLKFSAIGISALAAGLALCFTILAWQSPTAAPPDGNADAPINTGPNSQIKAGDLGFKSGANDPYYIHMDGASFSLKSNSGSERFIIDQNGHAGIGTTSPAKTLEVAGDTKSTNFCLSDGCCDSWAACAALGGSSPAVPVLTLPTAKKCASGGYRVGHQFGPVLCCSNPGCYIPSASSSAPPPPNLGGYCVSEGTTWIISASNLEWVTAGASSYICDNTGEEIGARDFGLKAGFGGFPPPPPLICIAGEWQPM